MSMRLNTWIRINDLGLGIVCGGNEVGIGLGVEFEVARSRGY